MEWASMLLGAVIGALVVYVYLRGKLKEKDKEMEKLSAEFKPKLEQIRREFHEHLEEIEKELVELLSNEVIPSTIMSSMRTKLSSHIEKFVPFSQQWKWDPADALFVGKPVDYLVFDGLSNGDVKKLVLVEVKTGRARMNARESILKNAIQNGLEVEWVEIRIPDHTITKDQIQELWQEKEKKIGYKKSLTRAIGNLLNRVKDKLRE
ncbi:MAG: hypothetical protein GXN92_00020 [Candidatus Micrarchaeota archaeon]|nr:hypothetical protein [Candidatus Micrarchaeota archaeon]